MSLHIHRNNKKVFMLVFGVSLVITPIVIAIISRFQTVESVSAAVSCNPSATKIDKAVCLQDMNNKIKSSMTKEKQYKLKDSRDGKTYYVAKLADGNIWMTQNLDLGTTGGTIALNSNNTDIKVNSSFTKLPAAGKLKQNGGLGCSKIDGTYICGVFENDYVDPGNKYIINSGSNKNDKTKTSGDKHYHVGNTYGRTIATAGSSSGIARNKDAADSICPAGWRLPSASIYKTILSKYSIGNSPSGSVKARKAPLYFVRATYFNEQGNYLTSTNYRDLIIGEVSANIGSSADNYNDGLVRCVARSDSTYKLHYNMNGGSGSLADSTINSSHKSVDIILSNSVPTRNGYVFMGWADSASASSAQYAKGSKITTGTLNKTIYAVWRKLPTYQISFDVNGGSGNVGSQSCTATTLTGPCNITVPATIPVRAGYEFMGWSESKNSSSGNIHARDKVSLSSSKTVYATWLPTHVIVYNANGGSNAPKEQGCHPATLDESCSVIITGNKPTRDHYKFVGWGDSAENDEVTVRPGDTVETIGRKELYAKWQKVTYVNTAVNGNGGTISESMQVPEGTEVTVTFTPNSGYKVASVEAPGIDTSTMANNRLVFVVGSIDINVSVSFVEEELQEETEAELYSLSFDLNGGEGVIESQSCESVNKNCGIVLTNMIPVRSGYAFLGWADSRYSAFASKKPGDMINMIGDKQIYAIWAPVYSISLDLNFGSSIELDGGRCNPDYVNGTCRIQITSTKPSRDGYSFVGWSESRNADDADYLLGGEIELATNKKLYAVWRDNDAKQEVISMTGELTWWQGQEYVKNNEQDLDLIIRIDYPVDRFSELQVDGSVVSSDNYNVMSGSTIVSLSSTFANSLNDGEHSLQINFNDGMTINTRFSVTQEYEDNTGVGDYEVTDSTFIEYNTMPASFNDQNFYNCVANEFLREYPNEIIADTGLSDNQLGKIRKIVCSGLDKDNDKKIIGTAGLEKMKNITQVDLSNNLIEIINVSENRALTNLDVEGNKLASIDITNNTELQRLNVSANQLSAIDTSRNTVLSVLDLDNNQLSAINVAGNTALAYLDLANNNITTVNVASNASLQYLNVSDNQLAALDVRNNRFLTWLEFNNNSINSIDVTNNPALSVLSFSNNKIATIDLSQNSELINLSANSNMFSTLNLANNLKLERLDISKNSLSELNIGNNINLKYLDASENSINEIDLSKNILLEELIVSHNSLSSLDLEKNSELESLLVRENSVSSIDLSNNTALTTIDVSKNKLSSLDVSKNDVLTKLLADDIIVRAGAKAITRNGMAVDFDLNSIGFLNFNSQTIRDNVNYVFNPGTRVLTIKNYGEEGVYVQIDSEQESETYRLQIIIKNINDLLGVPNTGIVSFDDSESDDSEILRLFVFPAVFALVFLVIYCLRRKSYRVINVQ